MRKNLPVTQQQRLITPDQRHAELSRELAETAKHQTNLIARFNLSIRD